MLGTPRPEATRTGARPPRYAGEMPLPDITQKNDEAALKIAELALKAMEKRRRGLAGKRLGGAEAKAEAAEHSQEDVKHQIETGKEISSGHVEPQDNTEVCFQETPDDEAETF